MYSVWQRTCCDRVNAHLVGRFGATKLGEQAVDPVCIVWELYPHALVWHGARCRYHLTLLAIDDAIAVLERLAGAGVVDGVADAVGDAHRKLLAFAHADRDDHLQLLSIGSLHHERLTGTIAGRDRW